MPTHVTFPPSVDALTPAWIARALEAAGIPDGARLVAAEATPTGAGAGMMSNVYRLALTYDGAAEGAPRSLVAKFTATNEENRRLGLRSGLYEREANFFRVVNPAGLVPAPACYAAEFDPVTGESVLLLEDLVGYRDGDQVAGCTAEQAKTIIDAVVPLHVAHWGLPDRAALPWLWGVDEERQVAAIGGACAYGLARCVENFGHVMTGALRADIERYVAALPALHRRMAAGVQTMSHGDLRLDNMMFRDGGERPVVLLDWQAMLASNPLLDIAYLISQNVTVDERRAHEDALIAHYHGRLVEHGITGFALDECAAGYRLGALYTLAYAVFTCGALDLSDDRGPRFASAMMERASRAVTDHGSLGLLDTLLAELR